MFLSINIERATVYQFLYCFLTVQALIGPGITMGYSSIALPVLTNSEADYPIKLTEDEAPLFASLPSIFQIIGCLFSVVTMKCGRRVAVISGGITCTIGWIIVAASSNVPLLFVGRVITGFATGMCATPGAVYAAEISKPNLTSVLTSLNSIFISVGIMIIYLLGYLLRDDLRTISIISMVLPATSAITAYFFMPESPHWLMHKGRTNEARVSLLKLRGLREETVSFQQEFSDLLRYSEHPEEMEEPKATGSNLFHIPISLDHEESKISCLSKTRLKIRYVIDCMKKPEVWKPVLILYTYFFFQQFCGIYVIIAYAVDVVISTGVTVDSYLTTLIIGFIQLFGGIVLVCCSAKVGRKPASLFSCIGMAISIGLLGIYNQYFTSANLPAIPLTCLIAFAAIGSFGIQVIPWSMIGEIYPTKYINVLGPLTNCFTSLCNFLSIHLYPTLERFDPIFTMYFYCGISVLATIFVYFMLPETIGKSRTEIEAKFKNSKLFR